MCHPELYQTRSNGEPTSRLIECAYCFRDFDSDNAVDSDDELVAFCSEDCMSEYKRERAEANVDSERDRD